MPESSGNKEDYQVRLDIPKDRKNGDLTSNIAMRLTRQLKMNPMAIGQKIQESLEKHLQAEHAARFVEKIDIVKPGFINFYYSREYLFTTLRDVIDEGDNYGKGNIGRGRRVEIEFVSANPTGPLTVAHGRQAAIGDALARILTFSGYNVDEEYFINDDGRQINILGESILHHYLRFYDIDIPFPEDGYKGAYIEEIAKKIKDTHGDNLAGDYASNKDYFSSFGVTYILDLIKNDLNRFGVHFDSWYSQRTLTVEKIKGVLEGLRDKGFVYDKDGATWFKATAFGDEKDRVVIKSDGSFTYFAPDIAYHLDKYRRGFDKLINIWGPDHHGYIPRLKAAVQALGYTEDSVSILLVQLATLYRDGKVLSMSTRKGEFITLKEVMDEVGSDVTKFFFLMRKLDSHLDFDLELAKHQSADNPVFYIQYAHARIWSIMEFSSKIRKDLDAVDLDPELLKEREEVELLRLISQFPAYVEDSAVNLEPYYVIVFLNSLATAFHGFYTKHKVVTDDIRLSKARLFLVDCIRICLVNGLKLLGVSFPRKM